MQRHLTLTSNLILRLGKYEYINTYLWLGYWRHNLDYLSFNVDKEFGDSQITVLNYAIKPKVNTYKALGISRQTWWEQKGNTFPTIWLVDDETFAAFLRFDVFDRLLEYLNTKSTKSREPYIRLYCYIYFFDALFFHHFQRSQREMAIELGMAESWLNKALNELVREGFIEKKGKYKFTGEQTFSYLYCIPDADRCTEVQMQQFSCLFSVYDI